MVSPFQAMLSLSVQSIWIDPTKEYIAEYTNDEKEDEVPQPDNVAFLENDEK